MKAMQATLTSQLLNATAYKTNQNRWAYIIFFLTGRTEKPTLSFGIRNAIQSWVNRINNDSLCHVLQTEDTIKTFKVLEKIPTEDQLNQMLHFLYYLLKTQKTIEATLPDQIKVYLDNTPLDKTLFQRMLNLLLLSGYHDKSASLKTDAIKKSLCSKIAQANPGQIQRWYQTWKQKIRSNAGTDFKAEEITFQLDDTAKKQSRLSQIDAWISPLLTPAQEKKPIPETLFKQKEPKPFPWLPFLFGATSAAAIAIWYFSRRSTAANTDSQQTSTTPATPSSESVEQAITILKVGCSAACR